LKLHAEKVMADLPAGLSDTIRFETYSSEHMTVMKAQNVFSEERAFNTYKFIVPHSSAHPAHRIDGKLYRVEKHNAFPLNPGQPHAFSVEGLVHWFTPLFIDKEFMKEICKAVFGTPYVIFDNRAYPTSTRLRSLLATFMEEANSRQPGYEFVMQSLTVQLVVGLVREVGNTVIRKQGVASKPHPQWESADSAAVRTVVDYLHAHFTSDFTLEDIAAIVHYSPYHLIRIFKAETGTTPFEYLVDLKIAKAKELLKTTSKNITEICFTCGFNNRSHFSAVFKRKVGVSPSRYRMEMR